LTAQRWTIALRDHLAQRLYAAALPQLHRPDYGLEESGPPGPFPKISGWQQTNELKDLMAIASREEDSAAGAVPHARNVAEALAGSVPTSGVSDRRF
jgi:hypothetical protein